MTRQRALGPRLFSLEEAEAQLPFVRECLIRFQEAYSRYDIVRQELSVLRLVSCSGADSRNPDSNALLRLEREQADLMKRLQGIQDELIEAGCVPKSIQDGLVDFFALKGGRLVFLCWKQGEDRIRSWHTLEGGFAGRRPIRTFFDQDPDDVVSTD